MADKPKSTADILAAIRNKGGGESEAAAPTGEQPKAAEVESSGAAASAPPAAAPSGESPKGTSNILASIRGGGGPAKPAAAPKAAAPAAGGEAPKGTSSILASIRGGGGAAPAGAAPAKKDAAAAKSAPKAPVGDRPSVQDMLKAVKTGVKAPEPGQPKAPPRLPGGQPAAGKAPFQPRRSVFAPIVALVTSAFALAWALMAFLGGVFTLKGAQFMMPNMVLELPSRFKVGVVSDYPLGSVSEKYKASRGIWVVHSDAYDGHNVLYALLSVCTHLGCTPSWLQGEQKFKCPCHGSGFYISGINFEGPAPRPLERVGVRITDDGQIEVDKSIKFQEELGQWADQKSYIELV
ncbi:MAG: ubiquinol-cytochrome c reductase iron-sulfur subunit [Planctomycetaceae bacterium]|nr:ubiquinol-cytochrome c reductase iron-sulfur subunit [Planctomycetaceae bacterium]